MCKVIKRTLKNWANTTNFIFGSPNTNGNRATEELRRMIKEHFPKFVEINPWDTFRDVPESYGCDKLIVRAWYWRGSWSDPTKEVYARFYLPRNSA